MTPKQKKLFEFISAELTSKGIAPSHDEMAEHMGLASKSSTARMVQRLAEEGMIILRPRRQRGIVIPSHKFCPHCGKSVHVPPVDHAS